eukprot:scaffold5479_cov199-Amphora_coffeaeformis.AAC.55
MFHQIKHYFHVFLLVFLLAYWSAYAYESDESSSSSDKCVGDVKTCGLYTYYGRSTCNDLLGCSWMYGYCYKGFCNTDGCYGTPKPCDYFNSNEAGCRKQGRCEWQGEGRDASDSSVPAVVGGGVAAVVLAVLITAGIIYSCRQRKAAHIETASPRVSHDLPTTMDTMPDVEQARRTDQGSKIQDGTEKRDQVTGTKTKICIVLLVVALLLGAALGVGLALGLRKEGSDTQANAATEHMGARDTDVTESTNSTNQDNDVSETTNDVGRDNAVTEKTDSEDPSVCGEVRYSSTPVPVVLSVTTASGFRLFKSLQSPRVVFTPLGTGEPVSFVLNSVPPMGESTSSAFDLPEQFTCGISRVRIVNRNDDSSRTDGWMFTALSLKIASDDTIDFDLTKNGKTGVWLDAMPYDAKSLYEGYPYKSQWSFDVTTGGYPS